MNREKCERCCKQIYLHNRILSCNECGKIQHLKCGKITYKYNQIKDMWLCSNCTVSDTGDTNMYNPFDSIIMNDFLGDSPENYEDVITFQKVLKNCKECKIQDLHNYNCSKKEHLPILFNNIDGMSSNFDSLHALLGHTKSRFGIVAIAETNIEPHHKDLYTLPGYQSIFGEKRKGKHKGSGIGIYFHESYVTEICQELTVCTPDIESLVVKINNFENPIFISVVYRPPNGCINVFLKHCEKLLSSIPSNSIICGDFNINLLKKESKMTKFEDVVLGNSYIPTISLPTHLKPGCTPSCIDNILVSNPENVVSSFVIEQTISHHNPIVCLIEVPDSNIVHNEDVDNMPQNIPQYDYCESNVIEFNRNLLEKLSISTFSADEEGFEMFLTCFNEVHEQCCKVDPISFNKSKRNRLTNPWITNALITSINFKNYLYQKWKVTRTKKIPRGNDNTYKKYKDYRKHLKHLINYSKKQFFSKRFDQTKGDSKKTWKLINELRGKSKSKLKSHFIINGSLVKTRRIIADEFNNYFSSIALKLNAQAAHNQHAGIPITPLPTFNDYLNKRTPNSIYLYDCNTEEIQNIIKELDSNKSSDISLRLIKMSASITSPHLSRYFSKFMQSGTFPKCLKQGSITPVHKKGNPQLLENYRPISTLPCFGKIFEKVIYKRLYTYSFFASNQLIDENQFGFRSKHSTSHAVNYSIDKIVSETEKQKHVLGIFIDLSKAFDTICHTKLTEKLEHYGIRGNALGLIESYLSDRTQLVNFNGSKSDVKPLLMGVPQGSVLGPLLFIIYINDITKVSNLSDFVMFADDTNIFVSGNSANDAFSKANTVLTQLSKYMLVNQLHINQSKCVFMHFKPKLFQYKKCTNTTLKLSINGTDIKCVNKARFLGVIIDDRLTWNDQIDSLAEKLNSCIISIKRIKKFIPKEHYMKLYHSLFVSHLTYGISAWGGVSHSKLGKIFF